MAKKGSKKKASKKATKGSAFKKPPTSEENDGASLGAPDDDGYQKVYSGGTGDEVTFRPENPGESCEGVYFDDFIYVQTNEETKEEVDRVCFKLLNPVTKKIYLLFESHVIKRFFMQDPGIDKGQWIRLVFEGKKATAPGSGRSVKLYTLQFNMKKQEKYADEVRKIIKEMNAPYGKGEDTDLPF